MAADVGERPDRVIRAPHHDEGLRPQFYQEVAADGRELTDVPGIDPAAKQDRFQVARIDRRRGVELSGQRATGFVIEAAPGCVRCASSIEIVQFDTPVLLPCRAVE